jgi:hypothetical protein
MAAQTTRNTVYVGKPIPVPTGYVYPNHITAAGDGTDWLLPIEVAPAADMVAGPRGITIIFNFDNTHWIPIQRGGSAEIDFIIPPERLESLPGYRPGLPNPGAAEVQTYLIATGLPSAGGDQIRIRWNGLEALYTGMHSPVMNLTPNQRNRLIYIPMRYDGAPGDDLLQMGILGVSNTLSNTAPNYSLNCDLVFWQQALHNAVRHRSDDVAQAVDYALKSGPVGLKEGVQVMGRTVYLSARGRGNATTQIPPASVHGQLNVVFGSDHKGWCAQIVDHDGNIERVGSVDTLRSRLRNTAGAMVDQTYNQADTEWGNVALATQGNVLVADRPLDSLAISEVVRGEHVSVMAFGHIKNRAEGLEIGDAKLGVIAVPARRRSGR